MRRPVLFLEEFLLLLLLSSLLLLLISKLGKHDKFAHLMSHIAIGDVATPTAPLARSLTAHNAAPHLNKSEKSAEHSLFLGQDGSDVLGASGVVGCGRGIEIEAFPLLAVTCLYLKSSSSGANNPLPGNVFVREHGTQLVKIPNFAGGCSPTMDNFLEQLMPSDTSWRRPS